MVYRNLEHEIARREELAPAKGIAIGLSVIVSCWLAFWALGRWGGAW